MAEGGGEEIEMEDMNLKKGYDDDEETEETNMLFRSEKYDDLSTKDEMTNMRKYYEFDEYEEKRKREREEGARMREKFKKPIDSLIEGYNKKKENLENAEKHAAAEDIPPLEKALLESSIEAFYARNDVPIPENLFMINFYRERDAKGRRRLMVEGPNEKGIALSFYRGTGDEQFYSTTSLKNDYLVKKYLYIDKNAVGDEYKPKSKAKTQRALGQIPTGGIATHQEETSVKEIVGNLDKEIEEVEKNHSLHKVMSKRDYGGVMASFKTFREQRALSEAKLSEKNQDIEKEKFKLEQAETVEDKNRINAEIKKLEDQKSGILESINIYKYELDSQLTRIKETMHKILYKDKTLRERIKTLFKEQGVTIVSILIAFGMTIGVIVEALTGGVALSGGIIPSAGGIKEWIKKLGKLLASLAIKAAAALPAIIGSIVSWLLTVTKDVVNWFANNLWALLVLVVGLLYAAAREYINK